MPFMLGILTLHLFLPSKRLEDAHRISPIGWVILGHVPGYLKIQSKITYCSLVCSFIVHTFRTDQIFGICLRLLAKLHRPPNSIQSVIFFYRYPDLHSYFVFNLPAVDKTTHQKKPLILALHTSHLAHHNYTGHVLGINRIF